MTLLVLLISREIYSFEMNKITPIIDIAEFGPIARNLNELLKRPDNADIKVEFPLTVTNYGGKISEAIVKLKRARELYVVGTREQFIVFAGQKAVGICIITNQLDIPEGLDLTSPNISGFIAHPFRGQGLGRLSIEEQLKFIKKDFNNQAWTFVKDGNLPSEHLVTSVGFQKSKREIVGWEGHHLYLFGDVEVQ